ncbi:polysaccharide biosynthesis protein [Bacteroides fragilis]
MNIRFYYKYLSSRVASKWLILAVDVLLVIFSMFLASLLQIGLSALVFEFSLWVWTTLFCVIFNVCFFHLNRTYVGVIRYSSFIDISRIFISLTLGYLVTCVGNLLWMGWSGREVLPISVILTAYIVNFSLMVCLRILVKMIHELMTFDRRHSIRVFVYGSKGSGINIAKSLRVSRSNHFRLKGFISDDTGFIGKQTMGCRVYANNESLFDILEEERIEAIIVSSEKVHRLETSGMIDRLIAEDIRILTVPPFNDLGKEGMQIKDIQIEDLLQRDPIHVDIRKISSHIEGKRIMITGAAGSIGREMVRQIAGLNPYKLILVDQAESPLHNVQLELLDNWRDIDAKMLVADVTNQTRMESIFKDYRPQYVFHAAAYKHVPMMEDNVSEAIQVNVLGTRIMADLAVKYGVEKFVMVSTDKAVNPTNVMGCSKRLAEIYVQSLAHQLSKYANDGALVKFITTRFGNVLGSNGSVIPRFKQQIEKGGPVTVTHPQVIRYFMTIPEACQLVLEAGSMGNGGEIYIFDMGNPVKIVDLARRMIYLSGQKNIKIEFTGLRHGEKLYEELLNMKEFTCPTYHEKIMIAKVREYDYEEVKQEIQKLIDLSYTSDTMGIVASMKKIVPEFVSKNSEFEILDKASF